ncbi:GAF domain-containing protein [Synergistaceae bacterium OttesenSCG-928-I11]|nr:GAF domain-containing protein [Synergistaceae bacterium OttesenSCG-928-I11]
MNVVRIDSAGLLGEFELDVEKLRNDPEFVSSIESFGRRVREGYVTQLGLTLGWLREVTGAESGTIYIFDRYALRYAYVQNEALNQDGALLDDTGEGAFASNTEMVDKRTIYGYVVISGKILMIDDARAIPNKMPFFVSPQYDSSTAYRRVSVLTVPVIGEGNTVIGALQLVNKKGPDGRIVPFDDTDLGRVVFFMHRQTPLFTITFRQCVSAVTRSTDAVSDKTEVEERLVPPSTQKTLPWLEGSGVYWTEGERAKESTISRRIAAFTDYIYRFQDSNSLMDLILTEARDATGADAGTFYVVEEDEWLRFAYVQNDTLFTDNSSRHVYADSRIPITEKSISGYVALQRKMLNVRDAWNLPFGASYEFNKGFDDASGYRTASILAVPIVEPGGRVVAVLQLINSKDPSGYVRAFDQAAEVYAHYLSVHVMPHLLRSILSNRTVRKMLHMIELHDSQEGGNHVMRVASCAAEIFARWAENRCMPHDEIIATKDLLRPAAMLHDIGMVSVPDSILKKTSTLLSTERERIRTHCAKGAAIYGAPESEAERMAFDIILNHHQRWDGTGYTGSDEYPILAGDDISIYARATSVADTLDALVSPRVYKKSWTFAGALDQLKKNAGTQFDPEVVDAALEIEDTLRAIFLRFKPVEPATPGTPKIGSDDGIVTSDYRKIIWLA